MKDGYIKVAAATPKVKVADTVYNGQLIKALMKECTDNGAKVVVFPELCITGYTCQDLFWQDKLIAAAEDELIGIADYSRSLDGIFFIGLPYEINGMLYNMAAVVSRGEVLAMVPKTFLPNYNEFYEARYFTSGENLDGTVHIDRDVYRARYESDTESDDVEFEIEMAEFDGFEELEELEEDEEPDYIDENDEEEDEELYEEDIWISPNTIFTCEDMPKLQIAAEICEDLWVPQPPSITHAIAGANVIVNLSASDEITGKDSYRRNLVGGQSARLVCGYIYADAGEGESSTDLVFAAHNLIAENGTILAQSKRFENEIVTADLDIHRIRAERRRMTTYPTTQEEYEWTEFELKTEETKLERTFAQMPFVPQNKNDRERRCEEILSIQALGLKKRLVHTNCKSLVVGISGGLDSTLALLVAARACDMAGIGRDHILSVTMPCFGTTDRTYQNACELTRRLGATLKEVDIRKSVTCHFEDIGQDINCHDVTYENGQARERTQVLMDLANKSGGMVIGTGDMSELALGWATYNGDHMSMYGVNASVPKTLVRHLVCYCADTCEDRRLGEVLYDILDTPVSPELLPPEDGKISQKTEDLVGPYELHDFFLYYVLRFGYAPGKIYRIAGKSFAGVYDDETILKWLKKFYWRFFAQQFKRSCLPDGPKVGSVAVSPRGDLRMPSDAARRIWMEDLENIH